MSGCLDVWMSGRPALVTDMCCSQLLQVVRIFEAAVLEGGKMTVTSVSESECVKQRPVPFNTVELLKVRRNAVKLFAIVTSLCARVCVCVLLCVSRLSGRISSAGDGPFGCHECCGAFVPLRVSHHCRVSVFVCV